MKALFSALCSTALIAALASPVFAAETPERGITKAQVEAQLGSPSNENPAVGEPAISSWSYDDFTVYFEEDRVIHSVMNK